MDPDPQGMADYQLLGDGFGYHSGYGAANPGQQSQPGAPGSVPGGPGAPGGPTNAMMAQMMGASGGQSGYHQLHGPRPGLPGYPPSDPKSLHSQYGAYAGAQQAAQVAASQRGQYGAGPGYDYGSMSHLGLAGSHASGPPPGSMSLSSQLSSSSASNAYASRLYSEQQSRMRAPTPVHHSMAHPSYPGYGASATQSGLPYGHGVPGSSELWPGQSMASSHMQQSRPPYPGYPSPHATQSHPSASGGHGGPRAQSQFHGQSDYSAIHGQHQRPTSGYYPQSGPGSSAPQTAQSSSSSSHIPSDASALSSYSSSQGPFGGSGPSSQQRSGSTSQQRQSSGQYGSSLGGYGSQPGPGASLQPPPPPSVQAQSSSTPGAPRYPQQYPGYSQSPYGPDASAQSRLSSSPYGLAGAQPNSPGYRPPYPGAPSQLSTLSPRRSTAPTPPAGSPMPPTSRTPDRIASSASTASTPQTASNYPSPGASQLTSPGQGVSPSASASGVPSSLQQLEQMVMPHLGGSSAPSKPPPVTSSGPTSSYYGPGSGPPPPGGNSQNVYPHYSSQTNSTPHPVQAAQAGYYQQASPYQQQQSNASGWPGSQTGQTSASTSTSSSLTNTHSGASSQAPVPYSPANQQNSSLRSPQPSSASLNSTTTTTNSSSSKSSVSGPYQFDSQFSSPSNAADSFGSKVSDSSAPGGMLATLGPHPSLQSAKSSLYDVTGSGSFDSPITPQTKPDDVQDQSQKDDRSKESDYNQDSRKPSNDSSGFYSAMRAGSVENSVNSMPDSLSDASKQESSSVSQSPGSATGPGNESYLRQQSYMRQQHPSDQQAYMSQQQQQMYHGQSYPPHPAQQMSQFNNSFSEPSMNYDLGDQMNPMNNYGSGHESMMGYEQGYGQPGMENMIGGASTMGDYPGEMGNPEMGGMPYPSPYDDTFASEPPTKRKGKGRPKKDPNEPKKEKKPRQPRTPKSPRGRGRGRGNNVNMGDRLPPGPQAPPEFEGYSMPEHPDLYSQHGPHHHPPPPPPGSGPGVGPTGHPSLGPALPSDPYHVTPMLPPVHAPPPMEMQEMMPQPPPAPILPPHHQQLQEQPPMSTYGVPPLSTPISQPVAGLPPSQTTTVTPQAPAVSEQQPSHLSQPAPVAEPSHQPPPASEPQQQPPSDSLASTFDATPPSQASQELSQDESKSAPPDDPLSAEPATCDDMFSQSNSSSTTDQPLFVLPNSEDSSSLMAPPTVSAEDTPIIPPPLPVSLPTEIPEFKSVASPSAEVPVNSSYEFTEEQSIPSETPVKRKGKKRKVKAEEIVDAETPEGSEKKPKRAKKGTKKAKKEKVVPEKADPGFDLESQRLSEGNNEGETPIVNDETVFDEATQDELDTSQLDSSVTDTPSKGKKGKGKGTKPKKPKLKENKPGQGGKKKLPKLGLKFKKKNKKRPGFNQSDNSDLEKTPPPSPDEAESGILKRRSARNTKRTKYTDDVEMDLSGDESKMSKTEEEKANEGQVIVTNISQEDTMVVEKIMAVRVGTRELELEEGEAPPADGKPPMIDIDEYYVKYKNLSYLHCDWRTEEELEKGDKRIGQKLKRFKQKKDAPNALDFLDDEAFNPDYCEVDRILDVNIVEEMIPDIPDIPEKVEPEEKKVDEVKDVVAEETKATEDVDVKSIPEAEDAEKDIKETTKPELESEEVKPKSPEEVKMETEEADESVKEKSEEETVKDDSDPPKEDPELAASEEAKESADVKAPEEAEKIEDAIEKEKEVEEVPVKMKKRVTRHYLVKWQALSYEESTWELEDDLDPEKIKQFWRFKDVPPKEKTKYKKRPKPHEWKKLDASPVYKLGHDLRAYQLEGLNWLTFCWYNSRNCILADEMGLGKTIQSLAVINEMVKYGIHSPYLVIAPLSTIGNWQREFETWTDLNVITYHGSSASRNMIQEYEMYYKNDKGVRIDGIFKFQVMITTFEVVLTDCMELREINWRCCVIDEAHRLKNRNCKLLEGLRLLNMEHRVLLTGTPLQNNVEELFSLLNFLEPSQFASPEVFMQEFGDLKTEEQVDKLKAILKPMMLRRLKEDVEKSLAPKEETIVEVELTNIQKKYYRAILERNFAFLSKGGTYANMPNLMNTMMELRKCCIHPFLINSAEEQIMHDFRQLNGDSPENNLKGMVQASGKLVLIDKLLPKLRAGGHRVLIFSQMVRCLDILEDYIVQMRYPYERIDGRVRGNLRQAAIDRYSKPGSDRFVFLLCTRAGGLGINLTAADTVIIFDSDWNPQNDLQAQARCHRIGQQKAVKIYRLICRNTYEREMFDKASLKLGLDKAVLQSMNRGEKSTGADGAALSKKDVEDLLRKGAYGAIMDDDNAGDKFCEEDIDQILLRRTQVITIETEEKGSTFSKASFAASDNRSDIEIDDPNFWEKWAKKANIEPEDTKDGNELIVQEPRRRTQTKRFGQDDSLMEISEADSTDEDEDGNGVSGRTRGQRGRLGKPSKKGRRGRGGGYERERDEDYLEEFGPGNWARAECYKVEKGLLTFGWGRWDEFLILGNFRRKLGRQDVEDIARVILLYCLQNYKGDEKIKSFIWDLITPTDSNPDKLAKNHQGLNAPVPRGRKNKKIKKTVAEELSSADWAKDENYNPEILLNDEQYRKHLTRHANKILLRVRLLFYLRHEVIGELRDQVYGGVPAREIPIPQPLADGDPPSLWWDEECDKSLLIGVYKHGYDRYNLMRQDAALCFLHRCGPPDGAALLAEINDDDIGRLDDDEEPETPATPATPVENKEEESSEAPSGPLKFPSRADMNQRLRRVITAYQRHFKKQELRLAQQARHQQRLEKLERFEAAIKEREIKKRETAQKKWSRREEADFYRTISSYGVEYNKSTDTYDWTKFRTFSRLDKKLDETLTEYFKAFYAMCKRVTGRRLTEEEENLPISVDPISEERASRSLARIDLLSKIREEILPHPELDERLQLCQPSIDLPDWWLCGKHDKDLIVGAAKYGLNRLDFNVMQDDELSFKEVLKQSEDAELKRLEAKLAAAKSDLKPEIEPKTDAPLEEPTAIVEKPEEEADESSKVDDVRAEETPSSKEEKPIAEEESEVTSEASARTPELKKELSEDTEPEVTEPIEEPKTNGDSTEEKVDESVTSTPVEKMDVEEDAEKETEAAEVSEKEEVADIPEKVVNGNDKSSDGEEKLETESKVTTKDEEPEVTTKDAEKSNGENGHKEEPETDVAENGKEKEAAETEEKPVVEEPSVEKQEIKKTEKDTDSETEIAKSPKVNGEASSETEGVVQNGDAKTETPEESADEKPKTPAAIVETEEKIDDKSDIEATPVKTEPIEKDAAKVEESDNTETEKEQEPEEPKTVVETILAPAAPLLVAPTNNKLRWPKDRVLQMRLEQISYCVEKNEWPSMRHAFFSTLTGPMASASITTADSSPRAVSPGSLSSVSREPTPHPTPEHTPRRESISPVPEYFFDNPAVVNDSARRRRRRRKRYEVEAERAKLRNLLSQTIEQQQQQQQHSFSSSSKKQSNASQSLLNHASSFLPPLFNLPFGNLRQDIRNELLNDEKTASLILGGIGRAQAQAASKLAGSGSSSSSGPPPAHQNHSSSRRRDPMETMDLRFKTNPVIVAPPAPMAHKPSKSAAPEKTRRSPQSPLSVLDLSSGPSESVSKRSSRGSLLPAHSGPSTPVQAPTPPSSGKRSGKRIGSRIDALALNLQAKKMMEEVKTDPKESSLLEQMTMSRSEKRNKDIYNEMEKQSFHPRSSSSKSSFVNPPAAHSSSAQGKHSSGDASMFGKALSGQLGNLDSSKLPPAKANEASSILEQAAAIRQDLKKWLEDHPEFVAANPSLAAAAAAAMAFNPPSISSIPANTELLELPEGRRRGRRPKVDPQGLDVQHLTGDENVSVINRMTGKKITGSKAPPLKHLAEWLEKNPMFDVDPKWTPVVREKLNSFKTPAAPPSVGHSSGIRTRTSDRRPSDSSSSSSSRRTTAASLLAQSQSHSGSSHTNSTPTSSAAGQFGFPSSAMNPLGFNPNLLAGFPSMKMFMDMPTSSTPSSTSSKSSASSSSSTSASNTTTTMSSASQNPMFFPFGGLAGMGLSNPLFGFPGFSLPGLGGSNQMGSNYEEKKSDKSESKGSKSEKGSKGKSSSSSNAANMFGAGNSSLASSMPFLYPGFGQGSPNFLYPGLGLGGFSMPGNSPFASLAQSGLMNGLGLGTSGISGMTTTTTTSASNHRQKGQKSSTSSSKGSSGAPSGLSLSTASSLLASAGVHPTSAAAAAAMGDSDDESLKSLMEMGHDDDDDDLNGDLDELPDKYDSDSDYDARPKRKHKSKDLSRGKKSNTSSSKAKS